MVRRSGVWGTCTAGKGHIVASWIVGTGREEANFLARLLSTGECSS